MPSRALPLAVLLTLASATPRADVLVVDVVGGPGSQYTDIQPAVDAAQPGDSLLVRTGSYGYFQLIGKGLTLVADQGATVTVIGPSVIRAIPASMAVVVRGLRFREGPPYSIHDGVLEVDGCVGGVWLENCSVGLVVPGPTYAQNGLAVKGSAQVILVRSSAEGHLAVGLEPFVTPGMKTENSGLTIIDSSVRSFGDTTYYSLLPGTTGLVVSGGQVYAEGSTFQGGSGANGFYLFGCVGGQDGGDAVSVGAGGSFYGKRNTYIPGSAGLHPCIIGPPAPGREVSTVGAAEHVELSGLVRYLEAPSPLRELDSFTLAFDVVPFENVFLLIGTEPLGLFIQPLGGSLLVWGTLQILPVGQADGSGTLDLVLPMPPLPPGAQSQDFYLQAAVLNAAGVGLLGGGSAVTVLDASF